MNVKVYLPIGIPDGLSDLTVNTGITLTPKLLSVTPSVGSAGGSLITASVKGVGENTVGVTLVNGNGVDICASVVIPSYGIV